MTSPVDNPPMLVTDIPLNVTLDELENDPYPIYQRLQAESPVAYAPDSHLVLLTTWALCEAAGRDDEHLHGPVEPFKTAYGAPNILSLEGEGHAELRGAVNPPLRGKAVNSRRETLFREVARRRVEDIRGLGRADLAVDLLEPISLEVIGVMLGMDDLDMETRKKWFNSLGAYLVNRGRDAGVAELGEAVKREVRAYLEKRRASLSEESDGTVLWHLFHHGCPPGELRSIDHVIGSVNVLIVGGFQEPGHGIAATLLGVLPNEDYRNRLVEDPEKWGPIAFEEAMRWLPPFSVVERDVLKDMEIGGVLIPAGMSVGLVMGAANRDPARWERPEEYDLDRPQQNHMAFGFGRHTCVGHFTARGLSQVVLEETFRGLPGVRLDPDKEPWVHGWRTRGPKSLPAVWDA
ncbi:cytochrome P450 [Gordonia hongkongensis]|uniref:cytochrome P450 n=1 Tax=Gordonia hongkongensis TaxID=1701090 RepID=UPI003EB931D0